MGTLISSSLWWRTVLLHSWGRGGKRHRTLTETHFGGMNGADLQLQQDGQLFHSISYTTGKKPLRFLTSRRLENLGMYLWGYERLIQIPVRMWTKSICRKLTETILVTMDLHYSSQVSFTTTLVQWKLAEQIVWGWGIFKMNLKAQWNLKLKTVCCKVSIWLVNEQATKFCYTTDAFLCGGGKKDLRLDKKINKSQQSLQVWKLASTG